ncbi:MAG: type VI secretion system tube protein Hcp [Akkermansiaceae bacterium]|nr:type VI secretion system tube protein Hcp [Akkermansiaceae bacterium]MCF7730987.1 type VI secretion system tube protein Hcp [Akkermansiaceae bacterium]
MKTRLSTLYLAVLVLASAPVQASNFALLQVTGIPGEVTDPAFQDWIELTSLGLAGPLNTGDPGTLTAYKRIDKSSPLLARRCASGEFIKEAKLVLRRTGPAPDGPPVICVITMSDLLISSISSAVAEGEGLPTETVGLKCSRIFFDYFAEDGSKSSAFLSLGLGGADLDHDDLPDAWEDYYGLPTDFNNADEDGDGDGLTDYQELKLGTNPKSKTSRFAAAVSPAADDPNSIDISWEAVPGISYVVEWSPDLVQSFTPLSGVLLADTASMTARFTKSGPTGFFRVRPASP